MRPSAACESLGMNSFRSLLTVESNQKSFLLTCSTSKSVTSLDEKTNWLQLQLLVFGPQHIPWMVPNHICSMDFYFGIYIVFPGSEVRWLLFQASSIVHKKVAAWFCSDHSHKQGKYKNIKRKPIIKKYLSRSYNRWHNNYS